MKTSKIKSGASARSLGVAARRTSKARLRRPRPNLRWELKVGYPNILVVGIDEVGRGCLAGPVVAGAVVLPPVVDLRKEPWLREVRDSKLLVAVKREKLAPQIENWASHFAIGVASVEEVDRLNIHHASHLAMMRALEGLGIEPGHVLVDGSFLPKAMRVPATAIIKGDLKCLSIACASIIAKVWRDRHMAELDIKFPGYEFGVHKGYGTPLHYEALNRIGTCELHRRSFAPIAEYNRREGIQPMRVHALPLSHE